LHKKNIHNDPLLGCLSIICDIENVNFSPQAAMAGLPLEPQGLTPGLFQRAARQSGFSARIAKKSLTKVSNLVLPAILVLKNNHACVLKKVHDDTVEAIFPENPEDIRSIKWEDLTESYGGYIIYITPKHNFEQRSQQLDHNPSTTSWFWGTIFRYKSIFIHVFIAAFLTNLFVLVTPIYIMNIYDRVIPHHALSTLWALTFGAVIFFSFDFLARVLRSYLIDVAGRKADITLAGRIFQHTMALRMRQKPQSSGAFASYFTEFEVLRDFFTSATLVTIIDLPFLLMFIAVIWFIGGNLALIPLVAIPFILLVAAVLEYPTHAMVKRALQGAAQKNAILIESLNSFETIKILRAEGIMQKMWEDAVTKQSKAGLQSRMLSNVTINLTIFVQQIVLIFVLFYGVFLIGENELSMGGLVAVTILTGRATSLGQLVEIAARFIRSRAALSSLDKVMKLPNERDPENHYLHRPTLKGHIRFDKVSFVYPQRRYPALEEVSFTIKPGEKVAFIGRFGSGKSTLLKMLIGLYEPTSGNILVDGTDNSEIDPSDLRSNIGYVGLETQLFYGSVRDNISMGDPHATDEEMLQAAQRAGVDKIVARSPLGFDMPVGERGETLSSGGRQAVTLARLILANPNVLLLDEPTASADVNYEQELLVMLKEYQKGKTTLLVTHRKALLSLVDRIIVLDNGRVIADGPKETVLAKLEKGKQKSTEKKNTQGEPKGE
jgi:ATP-binding cassette, subfamily C, bacterial LapB